ncbi:glucan endo-1,3-beta-glucosidase 5-like [Primulina huaijiensis]|uniref:glucan endo-1,3-beta-glucosidase 5-like n=1 Tax=Primulina huaijiensis TaxID=1492673 RepID=UPI003CC788F9
MKKPSSPIFILGLCVILWSYNSSCADAYIGMNWGRLSSQRLIPSMVVDLLLQNDIKSVRIFSQSDNVLEAFYNSDITVTFGIANTLLDNYLNMSTIQWWIDNKIVKYQNKMKFGYATIGTNPLSPTYNEIMYLSALPVLKNMQRQLNINSMSHIKATTPHYADVLTLTNTSKPSEVDFRSDIKEQMVEYVRFLRDNDAPFMFSLFPIRFVNENSLDLEFAYVDNKSNYTVIDTNATYRNAFELLYDSLHWALDKAGAGGVKIIIGAIGWPTDSYPGANVTNAERFYKSFLTYIASGRGTPMRPNQKIDVFLHSLSDENRIEPQLGGFQRHWGIYKFNGEPKYKIDVSGKGEDVYPSVAKGVIRMPSRWCVFNENLDDPRLVESMRTMACNASDCSSMEPGGSCSNLPYEKKISYAFNRYFQTTGQASELSDEKCDMGGLGKVVSVNPSVGTCDFPVEILSAEKAIEGETFGTADNGGERVCGWVSATTGLLALILLLMII